MKINHAVWCNSIKVVGLPRAEIRIRLSHITDRTTSKLTLKSCDFKRNKTTKVFLLGTLISKFPLKGMLRIYASVFLVLMTKVWIFHTGFRSTGVSVSGIWKRELRCCVTQFAPKLFDFASLFREQENKPGANRLNKLSERLSASLAWKILPRAPSNKSFKAGEHWIILGRQKRVILLHANEISTRRIFDLCGKVTDHLIYTQPWMPFGLEKNVCVCLPLRSGRRANFPNHYVTRAPAPISPFVWWECGFFPHLTATQKESLQRI